MSHPPHTAVLPLPAAQTHSLGERIATLHQQVQRIAPAVSRMACALYEPSDDLLKTFINSTLAGEPLQAYQAKLTDSPSLQALAQARCVRVIPDLQQAGLHDNPHSRWLLGQGYRSSFTVPLFEGDQLLGFLFFDAHEPAAFPDALLAQLEVFSQLVALMISHEVSAVRALVGTMRVARDFAHLRDVETGGHLDRMARYARLIARELAPRHGLSDEFTELLFLFAPLHDIGKIGVPDSLLRKPGRYTPEERQQMQAHVGLGEAMVERLIADFGLGAVAGIDILRQLVAGHHEALDGSGYPRGLRGADVPMAARIVTVADIFDALTSRRVYKPAFTLDDSLATLDAMVAAGQLDGDCVQALRTQQPEVEAIMRRFADAPGQD